MNLIRIFAWALVLTAAAMSGPNVPAQILTAIREVLGTATRFFKRTA